jgi:putative ABC transport system ATP-binding protein
MAYANPVQVYLNGHDLRDLNLGQLHNTICLVRDAEIITGTLLDNVCLGRALALTEVRQVLNHVGLTETITELPDSLQTHLLPNGAPLTPEQCLRLTLARALIGRPRLLLLDKVLDRIDNRVLPTILNHLLAQNTPWTLIVTSQRAEIMARFHKQLKIVNGSLSSINIANEGAS